MASYLGRNVNLALLIIIIGVVVAMVGTTVFFQRSLQDRTSTLEDTSTDLGSCNAALENYQEKYSEAQTKVNETAQDIRKYDQLYEQKVGELKDTQQQLLETQTQREFEKIQKEKFQQSYETALRDQQQLELTVDSQRDLINSLRNDIDDLEDQVAACGS